MTRKAGEWNLQGEVAPRGGERVFLAAHERRPGSYWLLTPNEAVVGDPALLQGWLREARRLVERAPADMTEVGPPFPTPEGWFRVMERPELPTLADIARGAAPPWPVDQVLAWAGRLAAVLHRLHAADLRHRAIAPEYVHLEGEQILMQAPGFLAPPPDDPAYAFAPPEWRDERLSWGAPGDVFALGALVFWAVTGRRVWDAEARGATDAAGTPWARWARRIQPDVPENLESMIVLALDPDPGRRPTAWTLANAWGVPSAVLGSAPTVAPPTTDRSVGDSHPPTTAGLGPGGRGVVGRTSSPGGPTPSGVLRLAGVGRASLSSGPGTGSPAGMGGISVPPSPLPRPPRPPGVGTGSLPPPRGGGVGTGSLPPPRSGTVGRGSIPPPPRTGSGSRPPLTPPPAASSLAAALFGATGEQGVDPVLAPTLPASSLSPPAVPPFAEASLPGISAQAVWAARAASAALASPTPVGQPTTETASSPSDGLPFPTDHRHSPLASPPVVAPPPLASPPVLASPSSGGAFGGDGGTRAESKVVHEDRPQDDVRPLSASPTLAIFGPGLGGAAVGTTPPPVSPPPMGSLAGTEARPPDAPQPGGTLAVFEPGTIRLTAEALKAMEAAARRSLDDMQVVGTAMPEPMDVEPSPAPGSESSVGDGAPPLVGEPPPSIPPPVELGTIRVTADVLRATMAAPIQGGGEVAERPWMNGPSQHAASAPIPPAPIPPAPPHGRAVKRVAPPPPVGDSFTDPIDDFEIPQPRPFPWRVALLGLGVVLFLGMMGFVFTTPELALPLRCRIGDAVSCHAAGRLVEATDATLAFTRFAQACEAKVAVGCFDQARMSESGALADARSAFGLYTKACDFDHGLGCLRRAFMLRYGIGTGTGAMPRLALELYDTLCARPLPEASSACVGAGELLRAGVGDATPDDDTAIIRFAKACEGGATAGCLRLAEMRFQGRLDGGGSANAGAAQPDAARKAEAEAARDKVAALAAVLFGKCLDKKRSDAEVADDCTLVGSVMLDERWPVGDGKQAEATLTRACQARSAEGCLALARLYRDGAWDHEGKPDKTLVDAVRWREYAKLACGMGMAAGCAMEVEASRRPAEERRAEMFAQFEAACASADGHACARLARYAAAGFGGPVDVDLATTAGLSACRNGLGAGPCMRERFVPSRPAPSAPKGRRPR